MQNQTINNLDYKARSLLILGVKRTGKSTLAARAIHTHPAELILIYDWQGGEFAKRLGNRLCLSREDVEKALQDGSRIICYDAEAGEADPRGEGFAWFCTMVFEVGGTTPGRKLFVVDEVHELVDPYNIPEPLGDILSRGGRRMIDTVMIGRSANALQTEARDQVSELYVFRLIDANSIKYPKDIGLDADEIRGLKDTHFIYKDMRTGEVLKLDLWGQRCKPENVNT